MKRMPHQLPFALLSLLFIPLLSSAEPPGKENITLREVKKEYRYEFSSRRKQVEVGVNASYVYRCNLYGEDARFYEFFDDQTLLEDAMLTENGKKAKISKELSDYNVNDVFYSDSKIYKVFLSFPKADWENEIQLKSRILDPRYLTTIYFQEGYPVEHKQIRIVIPRWVKAEIKEFHFNGVNISKEIKYDAKEDADIYTYTAIKLETRELEDHSPGPSYYLPHLMVLSKTAEQNGQQFTYFNKLQDQYNWYHQLVEGLSPDKSSLKSKAEEIIANKKDDLEKVKALLYWVHENIRYIAFEDGIAGFRPAEAQDVLNKKYGDCKGMANLLKELLVSQGFDARLAWIGTNHIAYDYSTPSLCVDNHMICCLNYKGQKYFLDGTETFLSFGNNAERIQGRPVLIENGESFWLETVPKATADVNRSLFSEDLQLTHESLQGHVSYLYSGESKEHLLTGIHGTPTDKVRDRLTDYITNGNSAYRISNMNVTDINQIDGNMKIDFDMNYANAVTSFGDDLYVEPDFNKILANARIDSTRKSAYRFNYKYDYEAIVNISIPEGYEVKELPENLEVSTTDYLFSISYKKDQGVIRYHKRLQLFNTLLVKDKFRGWNEAITKLSKAYADQINFQKKKS